MARPVKPDFETARAALLYAEDRRRLGITMSQLEAARTIGDDAAARAWYESWTPSATAQQADDGDTPFRISNGPTIPQEDPKKERRRTIIGIIFAAVFVALAVGVVVWGVKGIMGGPPPLGNSPLGPSDPNAVPTASAPATPGPASTGNPTATPGPVSSQAAAASGCDPNYKAATRYCVPLNGPITCAQIPTSLTVIGTDDKHLDRNGDGEACNSLDN